MNEFELLRNVTIGQYIPGESVIHRLDPRFKLLAMLVLAATFSATRSLIANLVMLGFVLLLCKLAGISPRYALRGILPTLGFLILLFVLQLFYQGWREPSGEVYFEWWYIRITRYSVHLISLSMLRFVSYIVLLSVLTLTTTSSYLMHAIEILLSPLKRLGLPVHEFALMNLIAFRFIPTLAEELERIMKAQASRGADVGRVSWLRPDRAARQRLPLIVPLFINALRRADELVMAMEARGYIGGSQRSKFVQLHAGMGDWVALLCAFMVYLTLRMLPWTPLHQLLSFL